MSLFNTKQLEYIDGTRSLWYKHLNTNKSICNTCNLSVESKLKLV